MSRNSYDEVSVERGRPVKMWTRGVPVEEEAKTQLVNVARMPFVFRHVAAMPDVHFGIGAAVGSVLATQGAIIPAAVGVDIGCFTGDTQVVLADGKCRRLDHLAATDRQFFVYSCTPAGRIHAAWATARLTRQDATLVEVTLDDGSTIRCTPDHRFMMRDGRYAEAISLGPGTSLMPFHSCVDREGYRRIMQPDSGKFQRAHWVVARSGLLGPIPRFRGQRTVIHHRHGAGRNHKVAAVRSLDVRASVYCLNVPAFGNFALAAGVFVHNCGMMAVRTTLTASDLPDSLLELRKRIERAVPHGFATVPGRSVKGTWSIASDSVISRWRALAPGLERIVAKHPELAAKNPQDQLGTLGGGNHFVEICLDAEQAVWAMLHSGSRGIGNRIGQIFIELARHDMRRHFVNLPDRNLAYLVEGTKHFDDYVEAMSWAQAYAAENRAAMMDSILRVLRETTRPFQLGEVAVNCHHNYASRERHFGEDVFVTRKGAVRARRGELGIIPGSMGARSYIVRGLGNPESFESCSHGAGRRMSRTEARRRFTVSDHVAATEGVECRKDTDVIDETPAAYKDIDAVMAAQADLVEIVHTLKQVLCVKG